MGSAVVLAVIAVLAVLAVRTIHKKRLLFSCGGDCARCAQNCKARNSAQDPKAK